MAGAEWKRLNRQGLPVAGRELFQSGARPEASAKSSLSASLILFASSGALFAATRDDSPHTLQPSGCTYSALSDNCEIYDKNSTTTDLGKFCGRQQNIWAAFLADQHYCRDQSAAQLRCFFAGRFVAPQHISAAKISASSPAEPLPLRTGKTPCPTLPHKTESCYHCCKNLKEICAMY